MYILLETCTCTRDVYIIVNLNKSENMNQDRAIGYKCHVNHVL